MLAHKMVAMSVFSQCQQCLQPFLSTNCQRRDLHPTHQKLNASRKERSQKHRGGPLPATVQFTQNRDNASRLQGVQPKIDVTPARARQPDLAKQLLVAVALIPATFLLPDASAFALTIHQEPENALSFPTWVIHISSVIEWAIAMALVWKYAEVTGNSKWKGLTWGMMPLLGGALCACTYHFYYNSPDLDFLVAVQASLTWIGNATCAAAAYRIYKSSEQEGAA